MQNGRESMVSLRIIHLAFRVQSLSSTAFGVLNVTVKGEMQPYGFLPLTHLSIPKGLSRVHIKDLLKYFRHFSKH